MSSCAASAVGSRYGRLLLELGALLALIALALALRWPALQRNLPCDPEPDAVIVTQALHLDALLHGEAPAEQRLNTQYPRLLAGVLALAPGRLAAPAETGPLDQQLCAAARPYLLGRRLIVALGLLVLPIVYLIARRPLGRVGAWCACFLLATSTLHALYSTQARPHAALTSFVWLALLALVARARSAGSLRALAAGTACALPIACLQNGLVVLAPLALVEVVRACRDGPRALRSSALVLAPVAASIWFAYPEWFGRAQRLEFTGRQAGEVLNLSGHLLRPEDFDGSGFAAVLRFLWNQDTGLFVLGACGLVLLLCAPATRGLRALFEPGCEEWLLALAFGLAYFCAIGVYARTFGRFTLPLLPLLALGAAFALGQLAARFRAGGTWAAALLLVASALPVARLSWLWAQPTTREAFADWALASSQARDRIAVPAAFSVPLNCERAAIEALPRYLRSPWDEHLLRDPGLAESLAGPLACASGLVPGGRRMKAGFMLEGRKGIARKDADYVLVVRALNADERSPQPPAHTEPLQRFHAGRAGSGAVCPQPYTLDNWPWMLRWELARLGPDLDLYRE